jgi:cell division protein FtsB
MEKQIEKTPPVEKKGNKANKFMIAVIILLFAFCGYLIWQNMQLQDIIVNNNFTITEVTSDRDQVKSELEDMLAQYTEMEANNEELSDELAAEKAKIEDLIKKAKGKDWTIYKLRKETETLRSIMKGFVVQIDSLQQANIHLEEQNTEVRTELSSEKNKTKNLTEENEDLSDLVTVASYLKTSGLKAAGIKVKSNNTGRETDKAKRVNKIRTDFTILKNDITIAGKKVVYVRILTPDGKVLSEKTDDSNKFDFNGVRGLYSSKKQIDYKNQQMTLSIDWKKTEEFPVGEYLVEVYADGVDIGKTKFSLK